MNLALLDPFRRQIPDRIDSTLYIPPSLLRLPTKKKKNTDDNTNNLTATSENLSNSKRSTGNNDNHKSNSTSSAAACSTSPTNTATTAIKASAFNAQNSERKKEQTQTQTKSQYDHNSFTSAQNAKDEEEEVDDDDDNEKLFSDDDDDEYEKQQKQQQDEYTEKQESSKNADPTSLVEAATEGKDSYLAAAAVAKALSKKWKEVTLVQMLNVVRMYAPQAKFKPCSTNSEYRRMFKNYFPNFFSLFRQEVLEKGGNSDAARWIPKDDIVLQNYLMEKHQIIRMRTKTAAVEEEEKLFSDDEDDLFDKEDIIIKKESRDTAVEPGTMTNKDEAITKMNDKPDKTNSMDMIMKPKISPVEEKTASPILTVPKSNIVSAVPSSSSPSPSTSTTSNIKKDTNENIINYKNDTSNEQQPISLKQTKEKAISAKKDIGLKKGIDSDVDIENGDYGPPCLHVKFNRRGTYVAAAYEDGRAVVYDFMSRTVSALYRNFDDDNNSEGGVTAAAVDDVSMIKRNRSLGGNNAIRSSEHEENQEAISPRSTTSVHWSRRGRVLQCSCRGEDTVRLIDNTHPLPLPLEESDDEVIHFKNSLSDKRMVDSSGQQPQHQEHKSLSSYSSSVHWVITGMEYQESRVVPICIEPHLLRDKTSSSQLSGLKQPSTAHSSSPASEPKKKKKKKKDKKLKLSSSSSPKPQTSHSSPSIPSSDSATVSASTPTLASSVHNKSSTIRIGKKKNKQQPQEQETSGETKPKLSVRLSFSSGKTKQKSSSTVSNLSNSPLIKDNAQQNKKSEKSANNNSADVQNDSSSSSSSTNNISVIKKKKKKKKKLMTSSDGEVSLDTKKKSSIYHSSSGGGGVGSDGSSDCSNSRNHEKKKVKSSSSSLSADKSKKSSSSTTTVSKSSASRGKELPKAVLLSSSSSDGNKGKKDSTIKKSHKTTTKNAVSESITKKDSLLVSDKESDGEGGKITTSTETNSKKNKSSDSNKKPTTTTKIILSAPSRGKVLPKGVASSDSPPSLQKDSEPIKRKDKDTVSKNDNEPIKRKEKDTISKKDNEPIKRKDSEPIKRKEKEVISKKDNEPIKKKDKEASSKNDKEQNTSINKKNNEYISKKDKNKESSNKKDKELISKKDKEHSNKKDREQSYKKDKEPSNKIDKEQNNGKEKGNEKSVKSSSLSSVSKSSKFDNDGSGSATSIAGSNTKTNSSHTSNSDIEEGGGSQSRGKELPKKSTPAAVSESGSPSPPSIKIATESVPRTSTNEKKEVLSPKPSTASAVLTSSPSNSKKNAVSLSKDAKAPKESSSPGSSKKSTISASLGNKKNTIEAKAEAEVSAVSTNLDDVDSKNIENPLRECEKPNKKSGKATSSSSAPSSPKAVNNGMKKTSDNPQVQENTDLGAEVTPKASTPLSANATKSKDSTPVALPTTTSITINTIPAVTNLHESVEIVPMCIVRKARCTKLISALKRRKPKNMKWFEKPVAEPRIIDEYLLSIPNPMDFGTIATKLEDNKYASVSDFVLDARRVFGNCLRFNNKLNHNGTQNTFRPLVVETQQELEKLLDSFVQRYESKPVYPRLLYCWEQCILALNALLALKNTTDNLPLAYYFNHPVSYYYGGVFPPDYKSKVPDPIDLGTITSRIMEGELQSVLQFEADCLRVCSNCVVFYKDRDDGKHFVDMAERLKKAMIEGNLGKLVTYDKSDTGQRTREAALTFQCPSFAKPPKDFFREILQDLRDVMYTDKITKYTERASAPFEKPIDTEIYKDYCEIIETSISLQEIEGKIESGVYETPEDIELDLETVFRNCEKYNKPKGNDHVVKLGHVMMKASRRIFLNKMKSYDVGSMGNNKGQFSQRSNKKERRRPTSPPSSSPKKDNLSGSSTGTSNSSSKSKSSKGIGGNKQLHSHLDSGNGPLPLPVAISKVKDSFSNRRSTKSMEPWEFACQRFYRELLRHSWLGTTNPKYTFHAPVCMIFPEITSIYEQRIEKPMDLTTAEGKLLQGGIYESPQNFIDDIALVFTNAISFNQTGRDDGEHTSASYFDASKHLLRYMRWLSLDILSPFLDDDPESFESPGQGPIGSWKLTVQYKDAARKEMESAVFPIMEKSDEGDRYNWMETECEKLLKTLRHQSDLRYMTFFIKTAFPPDYSYYISKKMDWEICNDKLATRSYDSIGQVVDDLRLIFSNALKYNERGKGTESVSGKAYESAVYMSRRLEVAVQKMLTSVSDKLERDKLDQIAGDREIESVERQEEVRAREKRDRELYEWQKKRQEARAKESEEVETRVEVRETVKLVPVQRKLPQKKQMVDFEFPFHDENDNHEESHLEFIRQQKILLEKQKKDKISMQKTSMSTGLSLFAKMLERERLICYTTAKQNIFQSSQNVEKPNDNVELQSGKMCGSRAPFCGIPSPTTLDISHRKEIEIKLCIKRRKVKPKRKSARTILESF
mmetsp:Transcript_6146/g.7562  ORF Transcript_6146/g.7562 Transcript_6146/m.7562 type:complete len:2429 (+) Transcript_6146:71-7357(+)